MNEREANEIPKGQRWLWDAKWWAMIIGVALAWYIVGRMSGTVL